MTGFTVCASSVITMTDLGIAVELGVECSQDTSHFWRFKNLSLKRLLKLN